MHKLKFHLIFPGCDISYILGYQTLKHKFSSHATGISNKSKTYFNNIFNLLKLIVVQMSLETINHRKFMSYVSISESHLFCKIQNLKWRIRDLFCTSLSMEACISILMLK